MIKQKELDSIILNDKDQVLSYAEKQIHGMFAKFMVALDTSSFEKNIDLDFLEPNYKQQLISSIRSLKEAGVTLTPEWNPSRHPGNRPTIEWLEISHIKGVKVERGYNPCLNVSYCNQQDAWRGLIQFEYDIDLAEELNYPMNYAGLIEEMVLRAYVSVTTPYCLKYNHNGSMKESSQSHLLVLENQLIKPAVGAEFSCTKDEYLKKYRLGKWYICDVDGIFNGNEVIKRVDQQKNMLVHPEGRFGY